VGGTLPSGQTETGVWSFGKMTAGAAPSGATELPNYAVPISFPIPLAAPIAGNTLPGNEPSNTVHVVEKGAPAISGCPGSAASPKAAPGHLCIYVGDESAAGTFLFMSITKPSGEIGGNLGSVVGVDTSGAMLNIGAIASGAYANGSWAVTAPAS
jgi:hypothetical protein